jgi:hypothetical protein
MSKRRMHVQGSTSRRGTKETLDNEGVDVGNLVSNGNNQKTFPISLREKNL